MSNEENPEPFDVDDLYAAYQLQQASEDFKFGRTGENSRKLTRYLFYNVVIELLKTVMIRSDVIISRRNITRASSALFAANKQGLLLDLAIEAIDEYLTPNTDNSIFDEPTLKNLNNNLGGYMKSDQIGKGEIYKSLITDYARQLGRGKPSAREQIADVIKKK